MRPWGCPKCGTTESLVDETARDSEGYVVRLRKCNNLAGCDGRWETEEVVMAPGSFWGRAESRNEGRRARLRKSGPGTCHRCGGSYIRGKYYMHVAKSQRHQESILPPSNRSKKSPAEIRAYKREWKRRQAA